MLNIRQETVETEQTTDIMLIYSKYSAMLFGYLIEITLDRKQAEHYLLKVYTELANNFNHTTQEITNWTQLRRFANNLLSLQSDAISASEYPRPKSGRPAGVEQLSCDQQKVFQEIYNQGVTVAALALKLNQTEETIRKTLKEAFVIMKGAREN
jgi:hypothetical protein